MLLGFVLIVASFPRLIAEGVWWLARRGGSRTREQQVADIARIPGARQFQVPLAWVAAAFGLGLALIAAIVVLSQL